jgi:DNA-binding CsgD family transcriptional regulator
MTIQDIAGPVQGFAGWASASGTTQTSSSGSDEVAAERRVLANFGWKDVARNQLRRASADAALAVWSAVLRGEWTLIDHTDQDGKRYILARRNRSGPGEPGALTFRERQVLAHAAVGSSTKQIAHELELTSSSVSQHLKQGLRKLRLRDRTELVALFGPKSSRALKRQR